MLFIHMLLCFVYYCYQYVNCITNLEEFVIKIQSTIVQYLNADVSKKDYEQVNYHQLKLIALCDSVQPMSLSAQNKHAAHN